MRLFMVAFLCLLRDICKIKCALLGTHYRCRPVLPCNMWIHHILRGVFMLECAIRHMQGVCTYGIQCFLNVRRAQSLSGVVLHMLFLAIRKVVILVGMSGVTGCLTPSS
jgi:hypothetical protein